MDIDQFLKEAEEYQIPNVKVTVGETHIIGDLSHIDHVELKRGALYTLIYGDARQTYSFIWDEGWFNLKIPGQKQEPEEEFMVLTTDELKEFVAGCGQAADWAHGHSSYFWEERFVNG